MKIEFILGYADLCKDKAHFLSLYIVTIQIYLNMNISLYRGYIQSLKVNIVLPLVIIFINISYFER